MDPASIVLVLLASEVCRSEAGQSRALGSPREAASCNATKTRNPAYSSWIPRYPIVVFYRGTVASRTDPPD
jgi:hypothetical protein